jgi:hypothetical protein
MHKFRIALAVTLLALAAMSAVDSVFAQQKWLLDFTPYIESLFLEQTPSGP